MTSVAESFDLQLSLVEDCIGLHCQSCGATEAVSVEFVKTRGGDRKGCASCGVVQAIPLLSQIGV